MSDRLKSAVLRKVSEIRGELAEDCYTDPESAALSGALLVVEGAVLYGDVIELKNVLVGWVKKKLEEQIQKN